MVRVGRLTYSGWPIAEMAECTRGMRLKGKPIATDKACEVFD